MCPMALTTRALRLTTTLTRAHSNHTSTQTAKITAKSDERLDASVLRARPQSSLSRAAVQRQIRHGLVSVNGVTTTKPSHRLQCGDSVSFSLQRPSAPSWQLCPSPDPSPHPDMHILFEDPHILVLHKPAHMVTHPAPGNSSNTLVNSALAVAELAPSIGSDNSSANPSNPAADYHSSSSSTNSVDTADVSRPDVTRPGIVHRLDKGTSGVIVLAKSEIALSSLAAQFKEHSVRRWYIAISCGRLRQTERGFVEQPIMRDPRDRTRMTALDVSPSTMYKDEGLELAALDDSQLPQGARSAISWYTPLAWLQRQPAERRNDSGSAAGAGVTLMRWQLGTGRTHQVRVHAKHLGHPLLGDVEYGGARKRAVNDVRACGLQKRRAEALLERLGRPALHASLLEFAHPVTQRRMRFKQQPPEDFMEVLERLGAGENELEAARDE